VIHRIGPPLDFHERGDLRQIAAVDERQRSDLVACTVRRENRMLERRDIGFHLNGADIVAEARHRRLLSDTPP
jgi:hypothetical protein